MNKLSLIALMAAFIFQACTENPNDISAKRKKLAEYKTEQRDLVKKIEKLEIEIGKLDKNTVVTTKAKRIGIDTLNKEDFKHFVEAQGIVDAAENILAIQQMPGVVTNIYVREGDRVGKGQVLYTTDASVYERQIAIAETQLSLARTAYEKQQRLWDQNIGSEIQVLQAKTNKDALEKQISALRSTIEMTKCKSPINGTVDEVRVKLGDIAAPSQLMPGVRVVNSSRLVVKAKLADSEVGKLRVGDRVNLFFPDLDKTKESVVSYVAQVIDKQTRTFNVEVKLDGADANIKPNMNAKLKMNDEVVKNCIVIPSNVIQHNEAGDYVLVAENNIAVKKIIQTGVSYNGKTAVVSGLNVGDKLITFGYSEVVDGQSIQY